MPDFRQLLKERVLVADGALGTRLQSLTGNRHSCIDGFNLDPSYSEIVSLVHRSYVEAGADIIFTNTYGANAVKLERYTRKKQVLAINEAGASLARKAAKDEVLVAGSVGPLERPGGAELASEEFIEEVFAEQLRGLVNGGVDLFVFETFQDAVETRAALTAAQAFDMPVVFSIGGVTNGRTSLGYTAQELVVIAASFGVDVVGANCRGAFDILEAIERIAKTTSLPLIAMPNAGSPEIDRGRVEYRTEPHFFESFSKRLFEEGVNIIGGCCGTGPEHVKLMKKVASETPLPAPRTVSDVRVITHTSTIVEPREKLVSEVETVFQEVPFIISVEMRAGRTGSFADYIEAGRRLAGQGVHLFDVPDNAGAKVTMDAMVSAFKLQCETHIPTIMHLSASHRNLIATQSYLLGCAECGLQSILAVTGDHPNVGDHDKYASRVNDIKSSVNLLKLMRGMNEGRLFNGSRCVPTSFFPGAGFNPMRKLTPQLKWLEKKVEAGCKFIYTQPLYDPVDVERLTKALKPFDIPVLVGILPLSSRRNAEFFAAGKIPGVIIPDHILEKYRKVETKEEGVELGVDLAVEFLGACQGIIDGCYLIPPFTKDKYFRVEEILEKSGVNRTEVNV
jgi:methionine synthase I (cobalamin-dependent)/5,10-methylenetetrahydrofolate reductase